MKIDIAYSSSKEREVRLVQAFSGGLLPSNCVPEAGDPMLELKTELLPTWTHGGTEAKKALIHGQNHDRKNNERRKDEKL
nr:hypothetical protein [uncultured Oscillibacter sp.]